MLLTFRVSSGFFFAFFKITHFVILGIYHIVSCYLMMCQLQCLSNRFWKKRKYRNNTWPFEKEITSTIMIIIYYCVMAFLCHCFHHGGMVFGAQILGTCLISSSLSFLFSVDITISQKSRIFDGCTDRRQNYIYTIGFSSIIISRGIHTGTCYTEQIVITSRQMYKNSITKSSHFFFLHQ